MKKIWPLHWALIIISTLILVSCTPSISKTTTSLKVGVDTIFTATPTLSLPYTTITPTPQPTKPFITYGPDPENFPAGINPLTGEPVEDSTLLQIPALLVSISNFPATARPQAGLSFAPYVFEFSITEGQDRFLAAFYGQFPHPETPFTGNCDVRTDPFTQIGTLLGNRVWLDANRNGIQDFGESGIRGVCVELLDSQGVLLQKTTTDSNGYYGFNIEKGQTYIIEFIKPLGFDFTLQNIGYENLDSDADPLTGRIGPITVDIDNLSWDAGLFQNESYVPPTPATGLSPLPQVGPVRSGRLLYAYIGGFFQDSCLIDAFASPEVLVKIPHCSFVSHEDSGGGSMLDIERMKAIAEDNMRHTTSRPFNYTSNVFSDKVPNGGLSASRINVFYANLDQSAWIYDPLYQAYLRSVDSADKYSPGVLHADTDRLTGRQLHFENVIVVMADTDVVSPTNLDIHLDEGDSGYAYLFRDGQMFPIKWSTKAGDYEKQTGFRRPIQFINDDGSPAVLRPGHTWVIIVTPFSLVKEQESDVYLVRYAAPAGEAR